MCGIIAYRGRLPAGKMLFDGLRKLEYRGYDSAGIATLTDGKIEIRKGVGKVAAVDAQIGISQMQGTTGIAHTRWATTGTVTVTNAHPHASASGRFALVQNGIVENYQDLKAELEKAGEEFSSETDTEVIVKLIEHLLDGDVREAVRTAFLRLHGRNAFVLLDSETGMLYAAKKGSPLIMGVADHGTFLASDASPLLEHTREVIFIDDGEIIEVGDAYAIFDAQSGASKEKETTTIAWTIEQAQKGDYEHFMLKEIMEQRSALKDAIAQDPALIEKVASAINGAFGTYVVGCGSAGRVGLVATYAFSSVARKHLNFALGSEFPNYHHFLTERSLLIAISQSGETADTLEAIETAKEKGCGIVSIVNVLGSTMERIATYTVPVNAGPETAVCSTKATTNQMAIMSLLAYACAGKLAQGKEILSATADGVDRMLTAGYLASIKDLASRIIDRQDIYIIGRGVNYPIALEAAIKIQEVSYVHAEGFAGGELKHGPIALISKGTPLIALVANDETREDTISNAVEVKARGGFIIGISPQGDPAFDVHIPVPDLPETSAIVNIIPVQLLAYYLSVLKGNDVDMPRNLAKSVTVK